MLKSFGQWLGVTLLKWAMEFIYATCKVTYAEGADVRDDLRGRKRPVIFLFWHNRIFMAAIFLKRVFFDSGIHLTVLISQSSDGEAIANVVERWGGDVARGSSSRGGKEALTMLSNALGRRKSSVVITPDGPRGPLYVFQAGAIVAAQLTQSELVPVCVSPKRYWRLNSWDGFLIPKPFTELVISIAAPALLPRKMTEEEREATRARYESEMIAQRQRLDLITGLPEYAGKKKKDSTTAARPA
jgi:lysophospholipid acyltransferase (LPLAT)-like uncharacterized protein